MDHLLAALRGAGEETRLRLLALCARSDLTVSELTQILSISQPRVSRHLKVMCAAGLLERLREGAWVFYRPALAGPGAEAARAIVELLPGDDPVLAADRARLAEVQAERAARAQAWFDAQAGVWDAIRSLHVDEAEIEAALVAHLKAEPARDYLDLGTGTGRLLEVLGPLVARATGIDLSRSMLAVARDNLEKAGLRHCRLRQGDMYQIADADGAFDLITLHQVLHYAERPAAVIAEAARVLAPGGRLLVVDFAAHDVEELREVHNHRRLGFAEAEVPGWLAEAGLEVAPPRAFPGGRLTVMLWLGRRPADPAS
nr:metalloregulator ArsR/SmtB family transcription factor [Roseospirillum parvum]